MANPFTGDQEVITEGRKKPLKDDPKTGLVVQVSAREQLLQKLMDQCVEQEIGVKIAENWLRGNAHRADWLSRQEEWVTQVDEFINPIYQSSTDWGSTLHMPTIYTVAKTYHARMFAALFGIDPPFNVKSRQAANSERAPLIQELMRYTLKDWCNEYSGVEDVADRWIWDWCVKGCGILKARWHRRFTRFMDVVEAPVPGPVQFKTDADGLIHKIGSTKQEEREIERVIKNFEGPMLERIPVEDLLIVGGEGDPQKADYVMHSQWLTADDLWQLVDQGIFEKEAVEEVIASGRNYKTQDITGMLKQQETLHGGQAGIPRIHDTSRYQIIEAYLRVDLDNSGIASDIIVWIHRNTKEILRATYLYRVMPTGMRPFFKIDFHKRNGTEYGVGLAELMYSIAKEIDAIHNMRIDVGILTSLPWGFYRPTASMEAESLPIEPGALIPLDSPQTDVFFPNWGNKVSFGFQEEQALQQQIERMTSISDISLGIISGQGATRTATGTRAILGEANANLDVFLKRMNRGWKQVLTYVFHLLQYKLEPGFQFRIMGDDGQNYWREVKSREEIVGMYDFELEGNSSNSNKQIQLDTANTVFQLTQNPMLLQLGVVSPANVYEAAKNVLQLNGVRDFSKFITKPNSAPVLMTPGEVLNRALAGTDMPLDPTQDLQGIVDLAQHFLKEDSILGQFDQEHVKRLVMKMQEAAGMLQAMQQQQAQAANMNQMAINRSASTAAQAPQTMVPGAGPGATQ